MRILMAHARYRFAGGEDAVFDTESALLEQAGHTVIRWEADNRELEGMAPLRAMLAAAWNRDAARAATRLVETHRPDVVHFHNTFGMLSPAVYGAVARTGTPIVQTLHNFRPLCLNALLLRDGRPCECCVRRRVAWPGIRYRCYRDSLAASVGMAVVTAVLRRSRTLERHVDRFIAPSAFVREVYTRAGFDADRIVVKPNASDGGAVPARRPGKHVLFAGRLSPEKGPLVAIHAWRHLPDIPLIVVGDGPLRAEAERAAAGHRAIAVLAHQPRAALDELLADARILVVPSIGYETFGLTIVEAARAGVAVIASRIGALPELIIHEQTGLLTPPGDAHALSAAVRGLWDTPADAARLGDAAHAAYMRHYTPDACRAALETVYTMVACDRRRMTP